MDSEDIKFDRLFRPTSFDEYVGQGSHIDNLRVFTSAAKSRVEPLDHTLLCGPPGLGKTTLAYILAQELGVNIHITSGPAIEHKGALVGMLTKLQDRDIIFIDEIHRLSPGVEESLYPALESYQIDIVSSGNTKSTVQLDVKPFCLVGATTRTGLLTAPLLSRFGCLVQLDFYSVDDLVRIIQRNAGLLKVSIDDAGAFELAKRARGTPRLVNRLLRRVRDFAEVLGEGKIDETVAKEATKRMNIDDVGLDSLDRRMLLTIIDQYDGGPVGIDALAAALSESRNTLENVCEPYLLREGYLGRTSKGRIATKKAYDHLLVG